MLFRLTLGFINKTVHGLCFHFSLAIIIFIQTHTSIQYVSLWKTSEVKCVANTKLISADVLVFSVNRKYGFMNDSMAHASSSHTLHNPQPATIRNTSRNNTLQKPCDAFTQNTCSDGLTRLKVRHCYLSHCQTHRKITRKNWTLGQMWTNPTVGLDLVIISIFNELMFNPKWA